MTYTQLSNGSKGEEVRKLQNTLINKGYDVGSSGADGIYGDDTEGAVRQYQRDNGLTEDGIAGNNTLGKLYGGAAGNTANANTDAVAQNAMAAIEQAQKAPDYNAQIDTIVSEIMGRDAFSYDVENDEMYAQLSDLYKSLGQDAMEDTMAQGAHLTGGYGNTYAQAAGQQQYGKYMQDLNGMVPDLYNMALSRYQAEGDELYSKLGALGDLSDMQYERQKDSYDNLVSLITTTGYTPTSAELIEAGMSKEQASSYKGYYDRMMAEEASSGGSSGGGGGGRSSGGSSGGGSVDHDNKVIQAFERTFNNSNNLSYSGNAAAIEKHLNNGTITEAEAEYLLDLLETNLRRIGS